MAGIEWFKLSANLFNNRKIRIIRQRLGSDAVLVWIGLLCLAGEMNNGGVFTMGNGPMTEEEFAISLDFPVQTIQSAFAMFHHLDMIHYDEAGAVVIKNWYVYQAKDSLELYRTNNAARQKRFREKAKQTGDRNVTDNVMRNVTSNAPDKIREEEIRERADQTETQEDAHPPHTQFLPPTLEELTEHCREQGFTFNPEKLYAHYRTNGWKVSGQPMVDWKSACLKWQLTEKSCQSNDQPQAARALRAASEISDDELYGNT